MNPAKTYKQAMDDLRAGRITPEQFRAIARESRERNGADHDRVKFLAIAASNR